MKARYVYLAAAVLAGGAGIAAAQTAAVTYDPAQLPALQGKVAAYSLSPRGDVDGLILQDGTEVHLPPYLGTELVFAVKPGDAVTIHGLRARSVPMVQAMSVSNDASGTMVTDSGTGDPRGPREGRQAMTAQSTVKSALHGPRGEVNGVLLEDGTIVRLPPPEAQRLAAALTPGAAIYVEGNGFSGPLGKMIAAQAIGSAPGQTSKIAAPPPGHRPPGPGGFGGPDGHGGPDAPPPPPR